MSSSAKRFAPPLGRSLAEPGVEHLAGVDPGGQQRAVAEHLRVAAGGAVLGLAEHLADRRVQIDRHRRRPGPSAHRPGPPDGLGDHCVELAEVAGGERPQERPQRRWCHHPERQDPGRRAGAQLVGVIDVRPTGEDRRDQSQDLAARVRAPDSAHEAHLGVDQRFEPEADYQRRRHDQPGIGDQRLIVEGHLDPIDPARYWVHRKCLLDQGLWLTSQPPNSLVRRRLSRMRGLSTR